MSGQADEGSQLGMGVWKMLNPIPATQGCCFRNTHLECFFPTLQAQFSLSFSLSEHGQSWRQILTHHQHLGCSLNPGVSTPHPTHPNANDPSRI